mgnify:CR=1 FL=1
MDGMVALITGASSGIGRALAEQLHACGVKLALCARRMERLEDLNAMLGGGHLTVRADVSRAEDCAALIDQTVGRYGRIDLLVCNAGYGLICRVADTPLAEMRDIFATNVFGTTECVRLAVPHMLKQEPRDGLRGHIVIVSSAAARRGLPYFGAYSATKAAQLSLAEALRVELKPRGIYVTSVHPVGTDTEFFDRASQTSGRQLPRRSAVEVRQTPQHVARCIVRGIEKPRPEVWPARSYRWLLALAAAFPSLGDRMLAGHVRAIDRSNRSSDEPS